MNPILQSLWERRSVRKFEDQPVSPEVKQLLIESAIQAPTAGNQVLYRILDITDQALKEKLVLTCDNQPFIATAPLVFIFVADHERWFHSYEVAGCHPRDLGVGDLMLAVSDANIAAQNMVVAAQSMGLGSCYIGDIMEHCEEHRKLLNLPKHCMPACMLVLGYPTEDQKERKKPTRIHSRYVVCENTYQQLTPTELEECYHEQQQRDGKTDYKSFPEFMTAFCNRKYNSVFSEEMSRSVAAYLSGFSKTE